MTLEQILPWVLLLSIVAFAAWWIFRPSARPRKTDFRVITASAVLVLMTGGFIFWQSGFRGGSSSESSDCNSLPTLYERTLCLDALFEGMVMPTAYSEENETFPVGMSPVAFNFLNPVAEFAVFSQTARARDAAQAALSKGDFQAAMNQGWPGYLSGLWGDILEGDFGLFAECYTYPERCEERIKIFKRQLEDNTPCCAGYDFLGESYIGTGGRPLIRADGPCNLDCCICVLPQCPDCPESAQVLADGSCCTDCTDQPTVETPGGSGSLGQAGGSGSLGQAGGSDAGGSDDDGSAQLAAQLGLGQATIIVRFASFSEPDRNPVLHGHIFIDSSRWEAASSSGGPAQIQGVCAPIEPEEVNWTVLPGVLLNQNSEDPCSEFPGTGFVSKTTLMAGMMSGLGGTVVAWGGKALRVVAPRVAAPIGIAVEAWKLGRAFAIGNAIRAVPIVRAAVKKSWRSFCGSARKSPEKVMAQFTIGGVAGTIIALNITIPLLKMLGVVPGGPSIPPASEECEEGINQCLGNGNLSPPYSFPDSATCWAKLDCVEAACGLGGVCGDTTVPSGDQTMCTNIKVDLGNACARLHLELSSGPPSIENLLPGTDLPSNAMVADPVYHALNMILLLRKLNEGRPK